MTLRPLHPLLAFLVGVQVAAAAGGQEPPAAGAAPAEASSAQAESAKPRRFQGGFGMVIGVPVGDFGDNVEIAAGLSGQFDVGLGRSPISVGGELTYLWYGNQSRDVPLGELPDLSVPVDPSNDTVPVETSNDIFTLYGRVRAQQREGRVRPYVDGLIGFIDLVTTTTVEGEEWCTWSGTYTTCGHLVDSVTNLRDIAFSAGAGAGIMVAFTSSPRSARLDIAVRYLYGGEAEYLKEGFIPWEGGPELQPRRSRTDMVIVNIGVVFGR